MTDYRMKHEEPGMSLEDARDYLNKKIMSGVKCPCCGQHAQVYRRRITSGMAYALILLAKNPPYDYLHLMKFLDGKGWGQHKYGNTAVLLKHWEFIEPEPKRDRGDGSTRGGYWKITPRGRDFAFKRIIAPKWVYLFNDKVVKNLPEPKEYVTIQDCLGVYFNYNEIITDQLTLI